MNEDISRKKIKKLQKVIKNYLDDNVKVPAFETIEKDFYSQNKIANILMLLKVTTNCILKHGLDFDKDYLKQLPHEEIEKYITIFENFIQTGNLSQEAEKILESTNSRKYLLAYLNRELNWVAISILSASYISSHIIMRSAFELLVAIATNKTGSMGTRVDSISFLTLEEKKGVKKLWSDLCGWSHPFGKWIEEACPIFISCSPMYHPKLCRQSIDEFEKIIDFFIIIGIEKFKIDKNDVLHEVHNYSIDISNLTFFKDRC